MLLGSLLVGVIILAIYANDQRILAEERTREVQSRLLAKDSAVNLNVDPSLALLLSVEAVRMLPVSVSLDALRNAVQATAGHVFFGDLDHASDLSWDPSGERFVSVGSVGTDHPWGALEIWTQSPDAGDWESTFLDVNLEVDGGNVAWSPDGSRIATIGDFPEKVVLLDPEAPDSKPQFLKLVDSPVQLLTLVPVRSLACGKWMGM